MKISQNTSIPSLTLFACALLFATPCFARPICASQPDVKRMSVKQMKDEIALIRDIRKDIGLFHAEGDAIQLNSPCAEHWRAYRFAVSEYNRVLKAYPEKRARIMAEGKQEKAKFRACFTAQLTSRPKLSKHELTPVHSIDEFEAQLAKLEEEMSSCGYAARFLDLNGELKRQGAR